MSLEETKQLLQTHKISPNKFLGQNFMVEPKIYPKLCKYAGLSDSDVVLDVGAGFGYLTCYLANNCKAVIAVEKDPHIAALLREQVSGLGNVTVVEGDVLRAQFPVFNKVVAIPPYYLSSNLVMWLLNRKIECAVLIVQKEFGQRLVASVSSEEYGWLTVIVYQLAEVSLLDTIPKGLFYPQPEVDSVIISIRPQDFKQFEVESQVFFLRLVKWLFTQRNKKLGKAVVPFLKSNLKLAKLDAEKLALSLPLRERRVRELSPKDFGEIANAISI